MAASAVLSTASSIWRTHLAFEQPGKKEEVKKLAIGSYKRVSAQVWVEEHVAYFCDSPEGPERTASRSCLLGGAVPSQVLAHLGESK